MTLRQEVDFETLPGGPWDGKRYSYIPKLPLRIDPGLEIFAEREPADPVTYQVLRWKLWGINMEHSDTIKRVSGSAVIVYMDDFATSILTGAGENVVMSPTIQYFAGVADLVVKWTLENRGTNPGIEDGDVFLQNDPYVGTAHQMDTAIYGPVFWQGKLLCWVYSCCHMGDMGGIAPGSFCVDAKDIYDEPVVVPAIKLARRGVLQQDVSDMFARQSRAPEHVALQIRSQMAGINTTRARIVAMVEQYGPAIVAGVMERIIDDCADTVAKRLRALPDGEWSERIYCGGVVPGDREAHPVITTIRKEGDVVTCSNAGTAPQLQAGNGTYGSWRSGLLCAASTIFAYDQMGCPGGLLRHMRFAPTPGLFNCAIHPAAVTTVTGTLISLACAGQVFSKLALAGTDAMRGNARAAGGGSGHGPWFLTWLDGDRQRQSNFTGDTTIAAIGASGVRDGIDQGGPWISPANTAGDVEEWEEHMPLLYLYRCDAVDGGGPGHHRGGNGGVTAYFAHKADDVYAQMYASDAAMNTEPGLAGGLAGVAGDLAIVNNSPLRSLLAKGELPRNPDELKEKLGKPTRIHPRSLNPMGRDEVLVTGQSSSGGFGDPLLRSPAQVAADVIAEVVSPALARRTYGVEIGEGGEADIAATERRRAAIRAQRLEASAPAAHPPSGSKLRPVQLVCAVGDSLNVAVDTGGAGVWACGHCRGEIAPLADNYKLGCRVQTVLPELADGDRYPSVADFNDAEMVMRHYLCPGCGTMLDVEFCHRGDPPLHDIRIDERWVRQHSLHEAVA